MLCQDGVGGAHTSETAPEGVEMVSRSTGRCGVIAGVHALIAVSCVI